MSGTTDWLEQLERGFGAVLRQPLDRATGTLRAATERYDPGLVAAIVDGPRLTAAEGLAVYNRQYWFRLLDVLQRAFPLTSAILGPWRFNRYAARFLASSPPRSWDIDRAADGLERFLATETTDVPGDVGLEAAQIDAAWRRVTRAPATAPYRPSAGEVASLLEARLIGSPAMAVVEEHWPLLALRRSLTPSATGPLPLPTAYPEARVWALVGEAAGVRQVALETSEAQLLGLLATRRVGDALAELEAACDAAARDELPAKVRTWLARSVQLGFWIGVER